MASPLSPAARHLPADDIGRDPAPHGPRAYLRYVVWPSLGDAWRRLQGGPPLVRRAPLRLSDHGLSSRAPRALLAYLRAPFEHPSDAATAAHPNWEQALTIADVLREIGYVVDVAGPLDDPIPPHVPYDLLIGELSAFRRCLGLVGPAGRRIYLATRRHPWWEYASVGGHLANLRARTGLHLKNPLSRAWYAESAEGIGRADAVISIGSPSCAQTYEREHIPIVAVGNTALFRARIPAEMKDYARASRHFLWLGSGPLANKGLAPVLAAFAQNPDLHLWVCGPLAATKEARTVWTLRRYLFDVGNIHAIGWVDVRSSAFADLLQRCGWIVSASYSESLSSSVVLAVANGLVPIVGPEVGLDCADFGLRLARPDAADVGDAIQRAGALSADELRSRSERALAAGDREFTPGTFRRRVSEAMQQLLGRPRR